MSALAIAGTLALSAPILYTVFSRRHDDGEWDPNKFNGGESSHPEEERPPVQLNQQQPDAPPPLAEPPQQDDGRAKQQQQQIVNSFHMLNIGRYSTNMVVNSNYKTGGIVENRNEYIATDMTPDEKYKQNHRLNDIVFVVDSPPKNVVSFSDANGKVALDSHVTLSGTKKGSFGFNGQRSLVDRVENVTVNGQTGQVVLARNGNIQASTAKEKETIYKTGDAGLFKTFIEGSNDGKFSLSIYNGTLFDEKFQLVKGSRVILKPLPNKHDNTYSDRFLGVDRPPLTTESTLSPFYQQIKDTQVDQAGKHQSKTFTDDWRRDTLVEGRKRALDDIYAKHSRSYQNNTDHPAMLGSDAVKNPIVLNALVPGKSKVWNDAEGKWDDPSPGLKVDGIGPGAKVVFWDEETQKWSDKIKNYNPETKQWEIYDPAEWLPSMERPDITAKQASRMHRGFPTRPNGRSYVEPVRNNVDRHKVQHNPYESHVTDTARMDTALPVYKNNTLLRFGTDPKRNDKRERMKTRERTANVAHHENYVYNRGYGRRLNMKKKDHPEYNVRQPRKLKNTNQGNQEISAQENIGMVMRANTNQVDHADKSFEDERVNSSTENVYIGRHTNKRTPMNFVQKHNVSLRSTRQPLQASYGAPLPAGTPQKTVFLHEEGAARTTRPRAYNQTRGGIGSNVRKSKAVTRLNRINTIPGMLIGRVEKTTTLAGNDLQKRHVRSRVNTKKDANHRQVHPSRMSLKTVRRDYADQLHLRGQDPVNIATDATDRDRTLRDADKNQAAKQVYRGGTDLRTANNRSDKRQVRTAYIPKAKATRKSTRLVLRNDPSGYTQTKIEKKNPHQRRDMKGRASTFTNQKAAVNQVALRERGDADLHLDTARNESVVDGDIAHRLRNIDPEKNTNETSYKDTFANSQLSSDKASLTREPEKIQRTTKTNATTVSDVNADQQSGRYDGTLDRVQEAEAEERNPLSVRSLPNTSDLRTILGGPSHFNVPHNAERSDQDTLNPDVQRMTREAKLGTGDHTGIANDQTEYTAPPIGEDHIKVATGMTDQALASLRDTSVHDFVRHDNSERLSMSTENFARNE